MLHDPTVFRLIPADSPEFLRSFTAPDIKAIRRRVAKTVIDTVNAWLVPLGYEGTGGEWRKTSLFGKSMFHIQKDRRGQCMYFNAGTLPRVGNLYGRNLWNTADGFVFERLHSFCPELAQIEYETDQFWYTRLDDEPQLLAAVLAIIQNRMIPWMEARHRATSLFSMPTPQSQAKKAPPLFEFGANG
jgi:Domain of unknown function (DUF4304)